MKRNAQKAVFSDVKKKGLHKSAHIRYSTAKGNEAHLHTLCVDGRFFCLEERVRGQYGSTNTV